MKVAKKHISLVVIRICTILVMLAYVQTYGHNRAGRLALVEDASGGEAYYYGHQGEVVKTVRTVMASMADIRTYVHEAAYDSWNRVRTMTYPNGEVVTYHYNEAGQISSLTSNKLGRESVIIERTGYDKDGHTVYTKLGNGTETEYTYDDVRQRLQEIRLSTAGSQMMQNRYEYDKVDNILSLVNNVSPQNLTQQNRAKLGGMSSHSYQYDELNRLIRATGKAKSASYDMAMTFNSMSMPLTKVQTVDSTSTALSYNNRYRYDNNNHPTAPTQIGHDHYEYDANGNPIRVENDSLNTTRELYWDEDNRLMILSDNGRTSRYTYNHAGERVVKSHGDLEGVYINGAPQGITFHENDEFTLYPASIISVNKNRFTKHYFIGSQRIASRIGTGRFNNVYGRNGSYVTAGQQDYAERMSQIESQKEEYYKELGIPPGVPTMKGAYGDPENTGVGYNTIITELGDHSVPEGWIQTPRPNTTPDTEPGAPISWNDPQNPENPDAGYGYIADDSTEEETFFYHSDHLGSTSYITDQNGNITQYDAYLPYGELLIDEHSSSGEMPYKFNGKELDEETGLYYYGARYLQPIASVWYGVDPLTEEYTEISGYVYCHANPICLLDPDGQGDYYAKNGKWQYTDKKSDGFAYVEDNKGSHTFNKQKYTKLPISNSVLNQYANTVAKESSGNKEESYAIANTIMNISQYKKKSIEKTMQTEGIYGYNDGGKSTKYNNNEKYGMEAVLNALTNGKDYSNGALRWDGFDLAAKGYNHVKARTCGIDITPECFEAFKKAWPDKLIYSYSGKKYKGFAENFNSGKHPATQGPNKNFVLYKSVAVYGRTIFWGLVKNNKFHGTY